MKHAVLALGVLALAAGPVAAQPEWANKLFDESSKDFGTCPRGAQLKHTFKVKNIYKVPLSLKEMTVSCGCGTIPAAAKDAQGRYLLAKNVLQPEEAMDLEINMDATKFTGFKAITIQIPVQGTDAKGQRFASTATLTVQAVARQDVTFNPGSVSFGVVSGGQTPTKDIEVEYAGNLPWRILEVVKSANAPFTVTADEIYRQQGQPGGPFKKAISGRVGYRLSVKLKADAPAGPFKQELILKTNDPASPVFSVAVEGNIQAALTVAPQKLSMDPIKVGETKTLKVFVRGSRPFRITGVEGDGKGIRVELPAKAADSHILLIHLEPKEAGDFHRLLRIRTDLDQESATVTVDAHVEPKEENSEPPQ